ncbi:PfkB family carbohydrate kinase [Bifidobacterium callimiconis]|uniref:Sugar kinase n=1 Tax=Bifidobacterium callimiconis TaxID=2306973 RepID=A0A430FDJ7_9BIFI|nr:PfkB family carbohydrate kinase [Bifidobacterium callimiconis]RSX50871.1 sugar kinase [Bifidobacterium callimiconis]
MSASNENNENTASGASGTPAFTHDASNAPGKVISLGEVAVNLIMGVNTIPQPGGFSYAENAGTGIGGSFSTLQASARMGVRTEHAGIIGNGPWAGMIRKAFDDEGIVHTGQDRLDEDSGLRVLLSDGGPRKTLIAKFGAEAHGTFDSFDEISPESNDVLHISGNTLTNRTASAVFAFMRREDEHWSDYGGFDEHGNPRGHRYTIVINPSGAVIGHVNEQLIETLVLDRPIWTCNKREARAVALRLGIPITDPEPVMVNGSTEATMPELIEGLGEVLKAPVIIRTGAGGAWLWEPDYAGSSEGSITHLPGYATKATHTQSAGGCHTGVLCAMLARGADLEEAVEVANAASSIAVSRSDTVTGEPSCPTLSEAKLLIAQQMELARE